MTPEQASKQWIIGDRWLIAGVMPALFGEGCCAYCKKLGAPFWTGRRDINGARMSAHVHFDSGDDVYGNGPDEWLIFNYETGHPVLIATTYSREDAENIVMWAKQADE